MQTQDIKKQLFRTKLSSLLATAGSQLLSHGCSPVLPRANFGKFLLLFVSALLNLHILDLAYLELVNLLSVVVPLCFFFFFF